MIYLKLHGRLGNQMFQYAYARWLQLKYYPEKELIFCCEDNIKKCRFKNQLEDFNVIYSKEIQKFPIPAHKQLIRLICEPLNRIGLNKLAWTIQNVQGLYCGRDTINYYPSIKTRKKNIYCSGLYESSKYFDEIKKILLDEFKPKFSLDVYKEKIIEEIENCESVCISIRRGDFLDDMYRENHFVCNEDYFYNAIRIMKKKVANARFYIFSDDIEWVKNNMHFDESVVYEEKGNAVWEKLELMSACKHFIISNSTFSWWCQFLSKSKDKIVIAPFPWKNLEQRNDIFEEDWILLDSRKNWEKLYE